jgi:Holliday junction resolvasome RuvABC endonuclease subunit
VGGSEVMDVRLMSFDVSSVSTGFSFFIAGKLDHCGVIVPPQHHIYDISEKLVYFKREVEKWFFILKPNRVVIEDTYLKNVTTLKVLTQYVGVLQLTCGEVDIKPDFVSPNSVRSVFGVKTKEEAFDYVMNKYKVMLKKYHLTFENGNDITDSILQGLYWIKDNSDE